MHANQQRTQGRSQSRIFGMEQTLNSEAINHLGGVRGHVPPGKFWISRIGGDDFPLPLSLLATPLKELKIYEQFGIVNIYGIKNHLYCETMHHYYFQLK